MANALEAASLVMIPSGYENGTLGSLKPTDGTGDFTFSRGSDISATRVNEDGYIEKGYENLLLQSNSFDTTWVVLNGTISGNQSGYDGTTNAWILESTSSFCQLRQNFSYSGVNTISIYAKANTLNGLTLHMRGSATYIAVFNLSNGTIYSNQGISGSIESAGDGWYRCSITAQHTNLGETRIFPSTETGDTSGTSGSIYIQDAMLNQGLVAYPYVETTTAPVAGGILEDMPRLDYSGSCPALLLEPQRTNLITSSEYFNDYFTKSRLSVSTNVATAPDGLTTASKLIEDSTNQYHYISQAFGDVGNHTTSVYAKAAERSHIMLWNGGASSGQIFNLDSGTKGGILGAAPLDSSIEDAGNGWYRCTIYNNSVSSSGVYISINDTSAFYQGDGVSGVYIYGFQVEQDATYPTSYIPTYGTSQTRLADLATDAGDANTFNSTEGVIFFEGSILDLSGSTKAINISASNPNIHSLNLKWRSGTQQMQIIGVVNSGLNIGSTFVVSETIQLNNSKYAMVWNSTNVKVYINGSLITTQTLSTPFIADSFTECNILSAAEIFYGNVKQFTIFPTALSDDECIELTTI